MNLPLQFDIPYRASALALYAPVAGEPWAMLLDSHAGLAHPLARFDIVVADPATTLVTRGGITEIERHGDPSCAPTLDLAQGDPFSLLRRELARSGAGAAPSCTDLPFAGGALGYFGYDLARRIERLPAIAEDDRHWPELAIGIYRWAALTDHAARRSVLAVADPAALGADAIDRLRALFSQPVPAGAGKARSGNDLARIEGVASNMTEAGYRERFERIARYIRDGHVYQVNLAQRFSARYDGDPLALYRRLGDRSSAPCSAFLDLPFGQLLSVSPERFLQVRDGRVETRPIKGTRPRHADPVADAAAIAELSASGKDRAENVMIVDLLRNDLGRCCRIGSVSVPTLFGVESFASVHHLVSTVTGELDDARDVLDLVRGAFPGGSITGAPKLRAMQIIEELEPHRRGVYCGAIGYIGFDGAADLNIAIRTAMLRDGEVDFWAGGGIVADSDAGLEYAETLAKAAGFLSLAEG
ncbi:MAG: aminodeoxychorismate synthase component I [bacterium]|jgi:para-aminobenzoate synthetase component 1|nr:aminodeoxychorismate synthase component I [Betaproteobacteria bacterium]